VQLHPATAASSSAAKRSGTPARVAAAPTDAVVPSTATASTRARVGGLAASSRRSTCEVNARGAGSDGFHVRQRFSGSSLSMVLT
jgi:hypothetical protein